MRPPDLEGIAGRAWSGKAEDRTRPDHEASIGAWLVNVPGAHPFWSWWMVGLVHLRDIPGVPPANKHYPEAQYEFLIAAIDPDKHPHPDPSQMQGGFSFLMPLDVCEQFHGVTDAQASQVCDLAVKAIVDGHLSPDQDYRHAWKQSIQATVKHFIEGVHE